MLGQRCLFDGTKQPEPSIVQKDVYPTETLDTGFHRLAGLVRARHVEWNGQQIRSLSEFPRTEPSGGSGDKPSLHSHISS
jgi:hypothetical protein